MKVKLEPNYKRYYTVEEYEQAKVVIAYEKENDDAKVEHYAEMAVREFCRIHKCHGTDTILTASATTGKNRRAYNVYTTTDEYGCPTGESGQMDICIETYAEIFIETDSSFEKAILHLFAMLSDIWQIDGVTDIAQYMSGDVFRKNTTIFPTR